MILLCQKPLNSKVAIVQHQLPSFEIYLYIHIYDICTFHKKIVSRFLKIGFEVKYVSVSKSFLHIKTSFLTSLTNFNNISIDI